MRLTGETPIRICDLGGWTDTWFSKRGRVLSIAVRPGVSCTLEALKRPCPSEGRIEIRLVWGESYSFSPGEELPGKNPLVEAILSGYRLPSGFLFRISIESPVPPGAGTGTSAAVGVALLGTLRAFLGKSVDRDSIWKEAHRAETERLHLESGIQDQICAAYGGICHMEIPQYPDAIVEKLTLNEKAVRELQSRLLLVYLGRAHDSSSVHVEIIKRLSKQGFSSPLLEKLRMIPVLARKALLSADIERYGELMIENNEAQRELSPALIPPEADAVTDLARRYKAAGWKVNGAGGSGGSLSLLLSKEKAERDGFMRAARELKADIPGLSLFPVRIDPDGLKISKLQGPWRFERRFIGMHFWWR